jgi:hypothetical protein
MFVCSGVSWAGVGAVACSTPDRGCTISVLGRCGEGVSPDGEDLVLFLFLDVAAGVLCPGISDKEGSAGS